MHAHTTVTVRRDHRSAAIRASRAAAGLLVLALCLALPASSTLAGGFLESGRSESSKQSSAPEWAVPAAREPVEGEDMDELQILAAKLQNAENRAKEAIQNAETAQYQLTRARTRNYPRGEALEELRKQAQDTRRERAAAADDFSKLVEEARRAGMPMGTLSRYMDFDDRLRKERASWGGGNG